MFCPKCGSLLRIRGKVSSCDCGYETATRKGISERVDRGGRATVVASDVNPFATEDHVCPKCGFDKAVLIESQIAVRETWNNSETDRPSYVCGRCGFRDYID